MIGLGIVQAYSIFTDFANQWYWLPLAVIYTMVVNDIFVHRICSHKMFNIDPSRWTYKFLTWWASADMGYGPVSYMTMSHNLHHVYSDQGPRDVMNWRHHWYAETIASPLPRFNPEPVTESYQAKQLRVHKTILTDPWTIFCGRHQVEIAVVTQLLLFLLAPLFLFNVMYLGRFLLSVMTGLAGFCGHVKNFPGSYRNFDTKDTTSNNIFLHYLFFGMFAGMLQNNHHGKQSAETPHCHWWEFDATKPFVVVLKYFIQQRH